MTRKITFLALFPLLSMFSYSQVQEFSCVIDRSDHSNIEIIDHGDTSFLKSDSANKVAYEGLKVSYQFAWGKGRKRDVNGYKERNKLYLVGSNSDTLLFTAEGNTLIYMDDTTVVERIKTDFGWQYIQQKDSTVLCEIDLLWNNSSWNYNIKYFESNQNVAKLKKAVSLSLLGMAKKRSKCKCDDGDDDTLFFVLWAASLATNTCN